MNALAHELRHTTMIWCWGCEHEITTSEYIQAWIEYDGQPLLVTFCSDCDVEASGNEYSLAPGLTFERGRAMAIIKDLPRGWEGSTLGGLIMHKNVDGTTAMVSQCYDNTIVAELVELNGYSPYCDPAYSKGKVRKLGSKRFAEGNLAASILAAMAWGHQKLYIRPLTKEEQHTAVTTLRLEEEG